MTKIDVQKVRSWLAPTAYDDGTSEYMRHLVSHVQGTGDWLTTTSEYQKWHKSEDSHVLWIKAVPGAGKSVIAAHTRARLSTENVPVLHFFFRQIISTNRTPMQLVRDWLDQLVPYSESLQKYLHDHAQTSRNFQDVGFSELWLVLRETIKEFPKVYCFADALDEMSTGYEAFINQLVGLEDIGRCKIFFTSRPNPRIVQILRHKSLLQITLGKENMEGDIAFYVDHRVERDLARYIDHRLQTSTIAFSSTASREAIEPLIKSKISENAQGSFLYARLMMDNLLEALHNVASDVNLESVSHILSTLPVGLMEMYENMLREHAQRTGTPRSLQFIILQWVTHSQRPLRLLELAAIMDFQNRNLKRNSDTKAIVRTACGPLLEILPSDVVGPVHHSFTEYLTSKDRNSDPNEFPLLDGPLTHRIIAEQCIEYIIHVYSSLQRNNEISTEDINIRFPFIDYANKHGLTHFNKSQNPDVQLLDRLLVDQTEIRNVWVKTFSGLYDRWYKYDKKKKFDEWPKHITPMHIAAYAGLKQYVLHLASLDHNLEALDLCENTPVHLAAKQGHCEALESLISAGANNNPANVYGLTPLHLAARGNHVDAVHVLLKSGVDPLTPKTKENPGRKCGNARRTVGDTPVKYAATAGHTSTVMLFAEYLNADQLSEMLYFAISSQKTETALEIINRTSFEPGRLIHSQTLVFVACEQRDLLCMQALIEKGCPVNSTQTFTRSHFSRMDPKISTLTGNPLHAFVGTQFSSCSRGREQLDPEAIAEGLDMLLNAGCSIEEADADGRTPLYLARADLALVSVLLSKGANPDSATIKGSTPLHEIAGRNKEAMELWMQHGLDINQRDREGNTPLLVMFGPREQLAADRVSTLLALGADPTMCTYQGMTALHLLCGSIWHNEICDITRMLIEAGADVNAHSSSGLTPLMLLGQNISLRTNITRFKDCVALLKGAGADLEAKCKEGKTFFLHSIPNVNNALDFNPDICARSVDGETALHLFYQSPREEQGLETLLDLGCDPRALDSDGNTILHSAVRHMHTLDNNGALRMGEFSTGIVWPEICQFKVNPRSRNNYGQTALHIAVAHSNTDAIKFLIDEKNYVDIDAADNNGITPLHIAVATSVSITVFLLKRKANPALRTRSGQTVFHFAAQAGQVEILSLLIHHLKNRSKDMINELDAEERTALYYAARSGVAESVITLLDAGADPNLFGKGNAPLNACARYKLEQEARKSVESQLGPRDMLNRGKAVKNGAFTNGWEEMIRILRHISLQPPFRQISIRRCVRSLISAGAEVLRQSDTNGFSSKEWLDATALHEACDLDCKPMIEELMSAIRSQEELSGHKKNYLTNGDQLLKISLLEAEAKLLQEFILSQREVFLDSLAQIFLSEDNPGMIRILQENGLDLLKNLNHTGKHQPETILHQLVRLGYNETVRSLAPSLDTNKASPRDISSEHWPSSLHGDFRLEDNHLFKPFTQILGAPLDGLLLEACQREMPNLAMVKALVEQFKPSLLEMNIAVFYMAMKARWWHIDCIEYLIRNGADINFQDPRGRTPLFWACGDTSVFGFKEQVVSLLLRLGADPNILNMFKISCLNQASGDEEKVDILLDYGANIFLGRPSLIIRAIENMNINIMRKLLKRGIDINQLGPDPIPNHKEPGGSFPQRLKIQSSYPLHYACAFQRDQGRHSREDPQKIEKHGNIIKELLVYGADPYAITIDGLPILHELLIQGGKVDTIMDELTLDLERRDKDGRTLLLAAASSTFKDQPCTELKRLLELGSDVKAVDVCGQNVLHLLFAKNILGNQLEYLKSLFLTDLVNQKDSRGRTPVHVLMERGLWTTIATLLNFGVDLTLNGEGGNTAFHHLVEKRRWRECQRIALSDDELLHFDAANDRFDNYSDSKSKQEDKTAEAIPHNFEDWVQYLDSLGIDINACNTANEPPLFNFLRVCPVVSVNEDRPSSLLDEYVTNLKVLIKAGLNIHTRGANGQGALHILAAVSRSERNGHLRNFRHFYEKGIGAREVWDFLVENGLDPWMEDNEQRSALDIAAASGNTAIMEMY